MKTALSKILFIWEKLAETVPLVVKADVKIWEQVSSFFQVCWGNQRALVEPIILVGTAQSV